MTDLYLGSFGQIIEITVTLDGEPFDMTDATVELTFVPPEGEPIVKAAEATLGKVTYVIEKGLLMQSGRWRGAVTVDMGDSAYPFPFDFEVKALI